MKSNVHFVWQQLISAQHKATMRGNVSIGPVPFLPDQRLCPKTLCYLLFLITNLQIPLMNSTMKGQHTEVKGVWFGAKSCFSCRDLIRIFVFVKATLARITQQTRNNPLYTENLKHCDDQQDYSRQSGTVKAQEFWKLCYEIFCYEIIEKCQGFICLVLILSSAV